MLRRAINWWDGITGPPVAIFLHGELFEATPMMKRDVQFREGCRWVDVKIDQIYIRHLRDELREVLKRDKELLGRNRELILVVHKELILLDLGLSLENPKPHVHFAALLRELKAALPLVRVHFHDTLSWRERLWMHWKVVCILGPFRVLSTWTLKVTPNAEVERPRTAFDRVCQTVSQILTFLL